MRPHDRFIIFSRYYSRKLPPAKSLNELRVALWASDLEQAVYLLEEFSRCLAGGFEIDEYLSRKLCLDTKAKIHSLEREYTPQCDDQMLLEVVKRTASGRDFLALLRLDDAMATLSILEVLALSLSYCVMFSIFHLFMLAGKWRW